MNYEDLTEEQKVKLREAKSPEEILKIAQDEGVELSIDELEGATGGGKEWTRCEQANNSDPY